MESKRNEAVNTMLDHYNCCQAVVLAHEDLIREYHPEMTHKALERMAVAFGGGVAGSGEICGALSGLCMVLGLISTGDFKDPEFKQKQRDDFKELMDKFSGLFGSVCCRDIKDKVANAPCFENDAANASAFNEKPCTRCVAFASDLIAEFLSK